MELIFSISFANERLAESLAEYARNVFPDQLGDAKAVRGETHWEVHSSGECTEDMFMRLQLSGANIWNRNKVQYSLLKCAEQLKAK